MDCRITILALHVLLGITSVSLKISQHGTGKQSRLDPGAEGKAHS